MSLNKSVILVSFDVPVETKLERREYRVFHKHLKQSGYILLQQSLYIKMICAASYDSEYRALKKNAPASGTVLALPLTLNSFQKMVTVVGDKFDFASFSDEILCF